MPDVVQLLIERDTENARDDRHSTPLHEASDRGHLGVVQQLIKFDAYTICMSAITKGPPHYAWRCDQGDPMLCSY